MGPSSPAAFLVAVAIVCGCSDEAPPANAEADSAPSPEVSVDDSTSDSGAVLDASPEAAADGISPETSPPETSTANKSVFVTSATYSGDLGGLGGADAKCQSLADAAMLSGTFKAWLSTSTSSPSTTFTRTTGDYVLVDGTLIAHGWTGLVSGTLLHAIDQTETKAPAPISAPPCGAADASNSVWTATLANGTAYTGFKPIRSCNDWTSASPSSASSWGWPGSATSWWSQRCSSASGCDLLASLYCFEQ